MVKQEAIAGKHAVSLPVVHRYPVGVELGDAVGATGVKGGGFPLRGLLY